MWLWRTSTNKTTDEDFTQQLDKKFQMLENSITEIREAQTKQDLSFQNTAEQLRKKLDQICNYQRLMCTEVPHDRNAWTDYTETLRENTKILRSLTQRVACLESVPRTLRENQQCLSDLQKKVMALLPDTEEIVIQPEVNVRQPLEQYEKKTAKDEVSKMLQGLLDTEEIVIQPEANVRQPHELYEKRTTIDEVSKMMQGLPDTKENVIQSDAKDEVSKLMQGLPSKKQTEVLVASKGNIKITNKLSQKEYLKDEMNDKFETMPKVEQTVPKSEIDKTIENESNQFQPVVTDDIKRTLEQIPNINLTNLKEDMKQLVKNAIFPDVNSIERDRIFDMIRSTSLNILKTSLTKMLPQSEMKSPSDVSDSNRDVLESNIAQVENILVGNQMMLNEKLQNPVHEKQNLKSNILTRGNENCREKSETHKLVSRTGETKKTGKKFKTRSDFMNNAAYIHYVRQNLACGVRVRRINGGHGDVRQGDVGVVTKVEDRHVWADWEAAGANKDGGLFRDLVLVD